jgi:hypothetical protein
MEIQTDEVVLRGGQLYARRKIIVKHGPKNPFW